MNWGLLLLAAAPAWAGSPAGPAWEALRAEAGRHGLTAALQEPPAVPPPSQARWDLLLIREFNEKLGQARLALPKVRKDGDVIELDAEPHAAGPRLALDKPRLDRLKAMNRTNGTVIKPEDWAMITLLEFHGDSIRIELNGGTKRKGSWQENVQVQGSGGVGVRATRPPTDRARPKFGATLLIAFEARVPEMTFAQFRAFLSPLLEFPAQPDATTVENPLDVVPEEFRADVRSGRVTVGMSVAEVTLALQVKGDIEDADAPDRKFHRIERVRRGGAEEKVWVSTWQYRLGADRTLSIVFIDEKVAAISLKLNASGRELPYP